MKNFDESAFLSSLSDIRWETAYAFDDVNDTWCHWESLLKQAIDHHAPLKRMSLKSNHLPWIKPAIQKQMGIRNLLKISVLMQRLFLLDARLIYSGKKLRPLLPNSKSSVNTSSISLLENSRIVPDTSASLNEYLDLRLQQF